ncbi:MAG: hypothetical protein ACRD19_10615, partial [Terriglobia bacterium]
YTISQLPPGTYNVSARYQGFKVTTVKGIVLQVNLASRVDITLVPGVVHQTVTVLSRGPVINTESAMVGQLINENTILEMPLNGRNFMQLTTLTGGINEGDSSSIGKDSIMDKGYAPAAAGLDAMDNNYQLNGVSNTDQFFHTYNYAPPLDSIQEFNIQIGQYSAQFGAGGGAVINVVTKSGTNQFHGSAYEFLRNTSLDSRNFFATGTPPLDWNQFGVSIGGPIKRDKAFFFLNYEGFRELTGVTYTDYVPSTAERAGDLEALGGTIKNPATGQPFADNTIPTSLISPISSGLLKYYPLPNVTPTATINYVNSPKEKNFYDNYLGRFDYVLSQKNSLMASYGWQKNDIYTPGAFPLVGGARQPQGFQNGVLGLTSDISPMLVNVARFGYDRTVNETTSQNSGNPIAANLGMTFGSTLPFYADFPESIGLSSTLISGTGHAQVPWFLHLDTYEWYDGVTWMHNNHSIQAGVDIMRNQADQQYGTHSNGDYSFSGQYTGN